MGIIISYFYFQQEEFSDMINSFFSLFRILIGDFDFQGIRTADYVLGPIFFASYLIVCLYIFSVSISHGVYSILFNCMS